MTRKTTSAWTGYPHFTKSAVSIAIAAATTALAGGSARAQDVRTGTAPPTATAPQPITIEVTRPVQLEVKKVPRVITDWHEGEPIPAGYHPVERVRTGAIVGGAVPFAVLYFLSALVAAAAQDSSNGSNKSMGGLYFPVVGPFITMTQTSSAVGNVFLAMDGILQGGGVALVIWGVTSPRTVLVHDEAGLPKALPRPMLLGRTGGGFGWSGSF